MSRVKLVCFAAASATALLCAQAAFAADADAASTPSSSTR
jgi:hemoglobin/transferrin/lactoferrin receptor protein